MQWGTALLKLGRVKEGAQMMRKGKKLHDANKKSSD